MDFIALGNQLYQHLMAALGYFNDSGQRLYWVYLIGAVVAIWLLILCSAQYKNRSLLKLLLSPKLWWHSSARQDYVVFVVNRIIRGLFVAPLLISMVPIAIFVSDCLEQFVQVGLFSNAPEWLIILIFTSTLFIFDDLSRFLLHYLSHKVPILWDYHKVHHSAMVLTPVTVYRIHPFESFLYATRMAIAQGVAVGISFVLFATKLHAVDILGANVFVFVFNVCGSNLRHSHVWLSWGQRLERYFISPAQHQMHHSQNKQYYDCNFGSALALWDRLFGTWIVAPREKPMIRFGTKDGWHKSNVFALYVLPLRDNLKRLLKRLSILTSRHSS